jgi:hypothetical protein
MVIGYTPIAFLTGKGELNWKYFILSKTSYFLKYSETKSFATLKRMGWTTLL